MIKLLISFLLIFAVIIFLFFSISFVFEKTYPYPKQIKYGVSFSPRYARYLKLDWQKTYLNILDELKVKNLRLPSYWNDLEIQDGKYDFSETDFMLSEAKRAGSTALLVLGARQPRWPECQYPDWAKKLSVEQRQQKTLELIKKVVERYKSNLAIVSWQIENEPFAYWFGECDPLDKNFLSQEIGLVKSLDHRQIILTDSGEWGFWVDSLKLADVLGISVYKKAYNSTLGIYLTYPFSAPSYYLKGALINRLTSQNKKIIVSELQAEPWLAGKDPKENLPSYQTKLFSINDFKSNIDFVKKTGFEENYLWGVEWWYWMAQNGYPQYLEYAETIFQ